MQLKKQLIIKIILLKLFNYCKIEHKYYIYIEFCIKML